MQPCRSHQQIKISLVLFEELRILFDASLTRNMGCQHDVVVDSTTGGSPVSQNTKRNTLNYSIYIAHQDLPDLLVLQQSASGGRRLRHHTLRDQDPGAILEGRK